MKPTGMLMVTAAAVVLVGCGEGGPQNYSDEAVDASVVAMELAPPAPAAPSQDASVPSPRVSPSATAPRMAYSYRYELELPAEQTAGLMGRHEAACVAAGVAACQVIGTNTMRSGQDTAVSELTLRASPTWIAGFRGRLASEAEAADGRVASSSTESEDLTRALVDTEARLRAQTTLRDRLQSLLTTRSGSLEELLKVESELARVQGEIDAVQSNLAVMRTRVATARLTISYVAEGQLAPDGTFRPVSDAVDGATGAFMTSVAALIWVFAFMLPLALIVVPLVWWGLKRRKAKANRGHPARLSENTPSPTKANEGGNPIETDQP